ncbi:MAG TPA: hypothetical protein VHQ98_10565, partial [Gaiellaceae bacterium]|nr:hypothetical protein [Gaiellaceae bacterium]
SQASRLSPEILAALPEWADPDEASEWPRRQLEGVVYKRCTVCGEHKLRTAFHRMGSMYDGRYPRCKQCRRNQRFTAIATSRSRADTARKKFMNGGGRNGSPEK